jgi:hypothetical protein
MSLALQREMDLACPLEFMHLTLTYDGPLHSATNKDPRTAEKNSIRRKLHPQLYDSWLTHPALEGKLAAWESAKEYQYKDDANTFILAYRVERYGFIPLITTRHHMICELDILFLRREQPGSLIHGGDIDNRLKVLFDALSMPTQTNQLEGLKDSEPEPFFTLLQDDRLITGLKLRTSQLHEPVAPGSSPSDVRLVIDVSIHITRATYANSGLGGG